MVNINVKLLTQSAKVPTKAHDTDACFDIYADIDNSVHSFTIPAGGYAIIHTGFSTAIPQGYFCLVYDRSSMGIKKHLRLCNSVGIIDSDYRGEWMVGLHNDGKEDQVINHGDRIAQFAIQKVIPASLTVVDELDDTDRGTGGFGSSGR